MNTSFLGWYGSSQLFWRFRTGDAPGPGDISTPVPWLDGSLGLGAYHRPIYLHIFALIGLIFPTAYSVVALTTTLATQEHEMAS